MLGKRKLGVTQPSTDHGAELKNNGRDDYNDARGTGQSGAKHWRSDRAA